MFLSNTWLNKLQFLQGPSGPNTQDNYKDWLIQQQEWFTSLPLIVSFILGQCNNYDNQFIIIFLLTIIIIKQFSLL